MKKRLIVFLFFSLAISMIGFLKGCSWFSSNSDELVYFPYNRPDNLAPILDINEEAKYLTELIFDGLVNKTTVDDKGREQYEWALVDKGGYIEEGPEDTRLVAIYLRKGVMWHDGREFTTEDVIYTWKAINQSTSPLRDWLNTFIEEILPVEGSDKNYKFKIKLRVERSREAFMELFSPVKILPRKFTYKNKEGDLPFNLNDGSDLSKDFGWIPVGTGPYKIVKRESDMVLLKPNESEGYQYYLGQPEIKRIRMSVEKEPAKAVKALKGSQRGLLFDVKPESFDILTGAPLSYQDYFPYNFYAIVYNTRKAPFNNPIFRKAVNSATNKAELAQRFIGTGANKSINTSIFPSGSMYVQEAPDNFREGNPYDPTRAGAYLNQVGGGERTFRLLVSSAKEGERRLGEFVVSYKQMMESVGIKVIVDDLSAPHYDKKITDRDFDAVFMPFSGFDHLYDIRGLFKVDGKLNIWRVSDNQLVVLLQEFGSTIALDKLNVLAKAIHSRIEEITPASFLFTPQRRAYFSNKLTNVTVHPEVGFSTVEKWKP